MVFKKKCAGRFFPRMKLPISHPAKGLPNILTGISFISEYKTIPLCKFVTGSTEVLDQRFV